MAAVRKLPLKSGEANAHLQRLRDIALRCQVGRKRPVGYGYVVRKGAVFTTNVAPNLRTAQYAGGLLITDSDAAKREVEISHFLKTSKTVPAVPGRYADEVEAAVREHFSPIKVKFKRVEGRD